MPKDAILAEQEVPNFHTQLDAAQFNEIYEASAEDLKTVTTKQDFVAFLSAVNRKLGKVLKSEKTTWNVNYHTSGTFITLAYNTTFTNGAGTEQFVYKLLNGRALLVGYHINSNTLITN